MKSTQNIIIENNYIFREIKEIKGKQNILPENIEILEDLTEIHEIKDIRKKPINFPQLKRDTKIEIRLERETIKKTDESFKKEKNIEMFYGNFDNKLCSKEADDKSENTDKNIEPLQENKKNNRNLLREEIRKRFSELKEKGKLEDSDDSI